MPSEEKPPEALGRSSALRLRPEAILTAMEGAGAQVSTVGQRADRGCPDGSDRAHGVLRTEGSWPSKPNTLPFEEPGSLRDDGRMTVKKLLERGQSLQWVPAGEGPREGQCPWGDGAGPPSRTARMSTKPTVRTDRAVLGFQQTRNPICYVFPGGNSEDETARALRKGRQVGGDAQKVPRLETGTHSSSALPAGTRPQGEETASAILGEPEEVGERTAHSRDIQGRALSQAPSNPVGPGTDGQTEASSL